MMSHEENPKSIKYHVKRYLTSKADGLRGKRVVDLPAGSGVTSKLLHELGCEVRSFDLFPEYFHVEGLVCERADVNDGIPLPEGYADVVVCQEGIEHLANQFAAFREFNRITKTGGSLVVTTPNYGNLRGRLSYLLGESERYLTIMPPNEVDTIWMNGQQGDGDIYFGHAFLLGMQKLRMLSVINGFRIRHVQFTRAKTSNLLLFPFWYPWIVLSNWLTYRRACKKAGGREAHLKVYREVFRWAISPQLLLDGHLFVEFEKVSKAEDVARELRGVHLGFDEMT
jgi:SAM-dependent methyltransferase